MISWLKRYYYWIIVAVMMLATCIYGGLANNISSIYIIPVTSDLGIARGDYSLAISMRSMVLFLGTIISGPVFKRFGMKKPIIGGLLLCSVGYALLSVCNTFLTISLACALIGLGESFVGTAAASLIVNSWFHRLRGSMLGLISACTGLGGGILSIVLSSVIQSSGWRFSRILSGICLLVTVVLVILLLRDNPSQIGIPPYGQGYVPKKKKHYHEDAHWMGFSMKELKKKPTFYLAILTFFLAGVSIYSSFSTIAPHLQDRGMSATDAAFLNGLMLIFLAVFKFVCGSLSDVMGPKWVSAICMGFGTVGLWLMPGVSTMAEAVVTILLYTISVPMVLVMVPLVTYPLFGYRSHDATMGIFLAMPNLGSLIVVPIANTIYDKVGSYVPVFRGAAILAIIVLGMLLLLYVLAKRDQKRYIREHGNS